MRSHQSNQINDSLISEKVKLCGWVHRRRDHGGLVFIDLRDREGLVQIVCDPVEPQVFKIAEALRNEYVIQVSGNIRERPKGTANPSLASGTVEVVAAEINILNKSIPLPFNIDDYQDVGEEVRLRYRFLDLRRPEMAQRMILRAKMIQEIRQFLDKAGFLDIETPILTKSTPEGARDYLVPSRTHAGQFFALPQSPQIFKELLMIAGFERYYQIVKCFRDEDLRADRQPEFTQLDVEMSFVEQKDIQHLMEDMIRGLFEKFLGVELPNPFPRITYAEAIRRFGTDRPDMRNPLELTDVSDIMQQVDFKVFSGPAKDPDGCVFALKVPQGKEMTRKMIDAYTKFVSIYGAKGLAYIKINDIGKCTEGLQSPILKFLTDECIGECLKRTHAKSGDVIFFGADQKKVVMESLSALRDRICADQDLYQSEWKPIWVTDFPMFEKNEQGQWQSLHHPFTAPQEKNPENIKASPGTALAYAYDIVLNGSEIGGGSIRISDIEMQYAMLELLDISKQEADTQFGHLLKALQFGCPPLGGIALGLDRIAAIMTKSDSIRDVIAFPKTQSAQCLLTNAPAAVNPKQLDELHIKVINTKK